MVLGCSCANRIPPSFVPTRPSALSGPCQTSYHWAPAAITPGISVTLTCFSGDGCGNPRSLVRLSCWATLISLRAKVHPSRQHVTTNVPFTFIHPSLWGRSGEKSRNNCPSFRQPTAKIVARTSAVRQGNPLRGAALTRRSEVRGRECVSSRGNVEALVSPKGMDRYAFRKTCMNFENSVCGNCKGIPDQRSPPWRLSQQDARRVATQEHGCVAGVRARCRLIERSCRGGATVKREVVSNLSSHQHARFTITIVVP
jgi:hypothetical protein